MLFFPIFSVYTIHFIVFLISSLCLCFLMLLFGFCVGGRSINSFSKNLPFESGINSVGTARLRFSVKFYLVAMIFVIFDAEVLYLYIWSIVLRELGWLGFIEISFFILFLLLGLVYLITMGILNWSQKIHKTVV